MFLSVPRPRLLPALAFSWAGISAQVAYTPMFDGLVTLKFPCYFGEMPGMPKTYVVLEHEGASVTLVREMAGKWTKDTLYSLKVLVYAADHEPGLLGIAFHPDFKNNRKYYISYNPPGSPVYTILEERKVDSTYLKDAGVSRQLLKLTQATHYHHGGTLGFGPKDGFLYTAFGDGGPQVDPNKNGQNKDILLSKMIRIDVDHKDAGKEYAVPADNPFAKGGGAGEIYAYGLRNPWAWTFDALNGDIWLGDVGQDAAEEVDRIVKGGNYGWSVFEADRCVQGTCPAKDGFESPVFSYNHPIGYAVIAGHVYRRNPSSKYYGSLFVGDYKTKRVWTVKPNGAKADTTQLPNSPATISAFGTDSEGHIYMVGFDKGIIYRLEGPDLTPTAVDSSHPGMRPGIRPKVLSAARGSRLESSVFGGSPGLNLFSPDGSFAAAISRLAPRIPENLDPGLYFIRNGDSGIQMLLIP